MNLIFALLLVLGGWNMQNIPAPGYVGNSARNNAQMKPAFESIVEYLRQPPGGAVPDTVALSGDAATLESRHCGVTPEAGSTDDLATIDTTGYVDGDIVFVSNTVMGNVITLTEAGNIGIVGSITGPDLNTATLGYGQTAGFQLESGIWILAYHSGIHSALVTVDGNFRIPLFVYEIEVTTVSGGGGGGGGAEGGVADGTVGTAGGGSSAVYDGGVWNNFSSAGTQGDNGNATGSNGLRLSEVQNVGESGNGSTGTPSGGASIRTPFDPYGKAGAGGNGDSGGGAGTSGATFWTYSRQAVEPGKLVVNTIGTAGNGGPGGGGAQSGGNGQPGCVVYRW